MTTRVAGWHNLYFVGERTWTLPKYEGATIGIAVADANAVYGQAKLVRFEEIKIKAFKSKDWQAKHHIHPSDKYWQHTVEAFKNGKHVYGWHFAEPLAYQEPVGFTNKHGCVSRHPLRNDALYKANVRNLQLGLSMQPGKMMKRSQVRGAALSGDVVVNAWANAHDTTEGEEDDEDAKAEVKGKAQAKCKKPLRKSSCDFEILLFDAYSHLTKDLSQQRCD